MHRRYRFNVKPTSGSVATSSRSCSARPPGLLRPASARARAVALVIVRPPVQLPPQDGLQLGMGLGALVDDCRCVAVGVAERVELRAPQRHPPPGHVDTTVAGQLYVDVDSVGRSTGSNARIRRRCTTPRSRGRLPDGVGGARHDRRRTRAGQVELWWPHSHGPQPLYDFTVELLCPDAVVHSIEACNTSDSARSSSTRPPTHRVGVHVRRQRSSRSSSAARTGFPTTSS